MTSSGSVQAGESEIRIRLNGEPHRVSQDCTIAELLADLELRGKRIAVELNGEIVPRGRHAARTLAEGDSLEIVQAIGGG